MQIFEQLVARGLMVFDPNRKVLTFNLHALAKFPAIRQQRIGEFKWLIGDWAFENQRIRLGNVYLITSTGYQNLSGLAPQEPNAIEKLMREGGLLKRHKDADR